MMMLVCTDIVAKLDLRGFWLQVSSNATLSCLTGVVLLVTLAMISLGVDVLLFHD